ncbi:hypothetical protein [Heyndrickxia ginsengihumi]|uniref:hypothetical protein n=1 Tax=Heyndrickxia ginsengihumi TaxID=363870 RepID=UPI00046F09C1|nr:hypothetical protein [Heyndrickxia ginsengihumi]
MNYAELGKYVKFLMASSTKGEIEGNEFVQLVHKKMECLREEATIEANIFKFAITDFEEVYAVIDNKKQRLHISPVNYSYSITLDLTRDLKEQINKQTQWGDMNFNKRVRKVVEKIIGNLGL